MARSKGQAGDSGSVRRGLLARVSRRKAARPATVVEASAPAVAAPVKKAAAVKVAPAVKKIPPAKTPVKKAASAKAAPVKKAVAAKKAPAKGPAVKKVAVKAPAKAAPVKAPGKVAPAKRAVKAAPVVQAPAKKVAPAKAPVVKKAAPAKVDPVKKAAPIKVVAAKAAPAKAAPPKGAPAKAVRVAPGTPPQGWNVKELAKIRAELDRELVELQRELDVSADNLDAVRTSQSDSTGDDQADAGAATFEREQEMSLANNSRDLLVQTERALVRLNDGTYGICEICGKPIGKKRLQAFPRATLCVTCKAKEERR